MGIGPAVNEDTETTFVRGVVIREKQKLAKRILAVVVESI